MNCYFKFTASYSNNVFVNDPHIRCLVFQAVFLENKVYEPCYQHGHGYLTELCNKIKGLKLAIK